MKIQSIAVIFAIIILPVIIIISYFIQSSIDTIALQTAYDTKLMDATHDAMVSFELNTANENLSAVSDSLRSIIEASTNVFFNTLATNLGMSNASKSYVQNYIPAILYTLYDGYYIYSPTRVPIILTADDEKVVYVGDKGVTYEGSFTDSETGKEIGEYKFNKDEYNASESEEAKSIRQTNLYNRLDSDIKYEYGQMLYKNNNGSYSPIINSNTVYKQDYVLKSYMPYSSRYLSEDGATTKYDITLNYTLDNYLTVEGYIDEVYYSKTGYLIAKDVVKDITAEKIDAERNVLERHTDFLTYNEDRAEELCLTGEYKLSLKIQPMMEDGVTRTEEIELVYEPYIEDGILLNSLQLEEKLNKLYEKNEQIDEIQKIEATLANLKAITYYVKSQIFSNWVYDNLGAAGINVKGKNMAKDIVELNEGIYTTTSKMDIFHDFSEDDGLIFDGNINPEKEDSPFYSHKLNVIKNSIQYNLNLAISSYDIMVKQMDIHMPVMTDDEWDKILNNVSVVSFMQGFNCGLKIYNNYSIVSSTNNELTVIPNEIYYTDADEYNTADQSHLYHRIDCEFLKDKKIVESAEKDIEYISFRSKEIKYDKIYDKNSKTYKYDHRNNGCYSCIVNSNYLKTIGKDASGNEIKGYSTDIIISTLSKEKQKEYYRAVAKERQNLYKTNALTNSNGYEVLFTATSDTSNEIIFGGAGDSKEIPLTKNPSSKPVNKIKEIELTLRDVQETDTDKDEATVTFRAAVNGTEIPQNFIVNLDQVTPQTIVIPVHIENPTNKLTSLKLIKSEPDDGVRCNVLSVRVIYE